MSKNSFFLIVLIIVLVSCSKNETPLNNQEDVYLLEELLEENTNIKFRNNVKETPESSSLTYEYFYNGSGVAIGDINNDNLPDIYFGGNGVDDKLYLNLGDFKFKDISDVFNPTDLSGWTTGINMVDINSDGLLDIYVCKSGPSKDLDTKRNKLFINQGNLTFVESAKSYNLDNNAYSIQSAFFDYDKDGDLDMYLLNHPDPSFKSNDFFTHIEDVKQGKIQTDYFFENVEGKFIDKSKASGLVNFGFRHGITVSDLNNDNYPDLYISSDFDEPDLLLINNKNKTFTNVANTALRHMSSNSMGNDIADINNDGLPDLCIVDMASSNHFDSKVLMKSMNANKFNAFSQNGFHFQYMQNTLLLNNGNKTFSDIAQVAGISKTDWSWAPLLFDIDLDGNKDLYVTNGIKENVLYRDAGSDIVAKKKELNRNLTIEEIFDIIPSSITQNNVFKNTGNLKFEDVSTTWIKANPINSNGVAYGDLDNDGDLDLVVNNMDAVASVINNKATSKNNYIKLKLKNTQSKNTILGTKVKVVQQNNSQYQEFQNVRGFLSSMDYNLVFGISKDQKIDSLIVSWPDNKESILTHVDANQTIELDYKDANMPLVSRIKPRLQPSYFMELQQSDLNINYRHQENEFNDYAKQVLLPHKQSTQGPCMATSDINGDGLEDLFIGGASQQKAKLFVQTTNNNFKEISTSIFNKDKAYEDLGALFFDADNDGDQDLYVASGGYEFDKSSGLLQDRLYLNDGYGNFSKSNQLPELLSVTKAVKALDFDQDGDLDLIVGASVIPGEYPLTPESFILENNNGTFTNVTQQVAPEFSNLGLIQDIQITDYNKDGLDDFMVVGSWMPITLFTNTENGFVKENISAFNKTEGWYLSIESADFDNDGDEDFVIGNIGENNKFHPSEEKPLHIFSDYFDDNDSYDMALSKKFNGNLVPVRGKECSSEQTPFLNEKIGTYKEFASLNIEGIYGNDAIANALHLEAYNFSTLYVENLGDGNFKLHKLNTYAQIGPTQDITVFDINNDGFKDIIGVGGLYDAEVETARYDASQGYILLGNGNNEFTPLIGSGFSCNKDMRTINTLKIGGIDHFIVSSNNDTLSVFKLVNN